MQLKRFLFISTIKIVSVDTREDERLDWRGIERLMVSTFFKEITFSGVFKFTRNK